MSVCGLCDSGFRGTCHGQWVTNTLPGAGLSPGLAAPLETADKGYLLLKALWGFPKGDEDQAFQCSPL